MNIKQLLLVLDSVVVSLERPGCPIELKPALRTIAEFFNKYIPTEFGGDNMNAQELQHAQLKAIEAFANNPQLYGCNDYDES
jgi:hypothetical protein